MKLRIFLITILLISIFLERLIISFPLMFLLSYIIFSIEYRFRYLIPTAIILLVGDAVLLNPIGSTLISVSLIIFLIYLYARFLGSKDTLVYVLFCVIGIVSYAIIFEYSLGDLLKWFMLAASAWAIYVILPKKHFSLP